MQADFDDIRFTQADGTTLIDGWLESKVDSTSAETWAEFPSTPANTVEQTYYTYYGKADAVSYWDIGATMLDGDDFSSAIDWINDWQSTEQARYTVSGGLLAATDPDAATKLLNSKNTVNNFVAEARIKTVTTGTSNFYFTLEPNVADWDGTEYVNIRRDDYGQVAMGGNVLNSAGTIANDTWYRAKIVLPSTGDGISYLYEDDGTLMISKTATPTARTQRLSFVAWQDSIGYVDWVFARKYASNPPTYAFGAEESAPTGAAPTSIFYGLFVGPLGGPI